MHVCACYSALATAIKIPFFVHIFRRRIPLSSQYLNVCNLIISCSNLREFLWLFSKTSIPISLLTFLWNLHFSSLFLHPISCWLSNGSHGKSSMPDIDANFSLNWLLINSAYNIECRRCVWWWCHRVTIIIESWCTRNCTSVKLSSVYKKRIRKVLGKWYKDISRQTIVMA